jgi:3-oxoacyl-[acyl-carrier protein] reductase
MDLGLEGKGVLVTGGAGGIGSAIVRAFAADGARVAVHYNSSREAAAALAAEAGGVALQADLTDEASADALVPAAVAALGRLDVCVANAGVWAGDSVPVWDMPLERYRRVVEGNLTATFLTCRAFLRHVRETGTGSIVLVTSTSGIFGEAGNAEYSAVKGGLTYGFARALKNEIAQIAPLGRVNVVAPGWTATPMTAGHLDDDVIAWATRTYSLRKVATPEDVAAAVCFFASDRAAGHLSGQIITVAGGMEGRLLWP